MRQLKRYLLKAPKPLLLQIGIVVLLVLPPLWWVQQQNVNSLSQRIARLDQQINDPNLKFLPKDRFALEKDLAGLEKDRVSLQNGIYTTLVQALGGAFFFVTAYLTWRNVKATEEKQVTERFSKAIEQLGSEKVEVQLGGIYSLERLAKDSKKDHWTIIEILTSFIRANSKQQGSQQHPSTSVQAALTVIGRRDSSQDPNGKKIDLSSSNLQRANFQEANFCKANFALANLQEANFLLANLQGALFRGATLDKAILRKANLEDANFAEASLQEANFQHATAYKASFKAANCQNANFRLAKIKGAEFSATDLRGAELKNSDGFELDQISMAIIDEYTTLPKV